MFRRRSVWGGLVAIGFTAVIASASILADQVATNHNIGWGLALFGTLAIIVGGAIWLLLSNQENGMPTKMAKADRGSVANTGDKAVIVNMPHFGDIHVAAQKDVKEDTRVFVREQSPGEVVERIKSLRPLERNVVADQTYVGRWVRWSGKIVGIDTFALFGSHDGFTVTVLSDDFHFYFARLELESTQRGLVEPLNEGDRISFEARIDRMFSNDIYLKDVRITDTGPPSPPVEAEGN